MLDEPSQIENKLILLEEQIKEGLALYHKLRSEAEARIREYNVSRLSLSCLNPFY